MNFKKSTCIFLGIVAITLLGLGSILFQHIPNIRILTSLQKTLTSQRDSLSTYLDLRTLQANWYDVPYTQNMRLYLDDITYEKAPFDLGAISGFMLEGTTLSQQSTKKLSSEFALAFGGTKLLDANFYAYEDSLALTLPSLLDGYFEVSASTFGNDFNNSALAEWLDLTWKGPDSLSLFMPTPISPKKTLAFHDFWLLQKEVQIQKSEETKTFQIQNNTFTCYAYQVILSAKAFDILFPELKDLGITTSAQPTLTLFLDDNQRILGIHFADSLTYRGITTDTFLALSLTGTDYLQDNMDIELTFTPEGWDTYKILIQKNTTATENEVTQNYIIETDPLLLPESSNPFILTFSLANDTEELAERPFSLQVDSLFHAKGSFREVNKGTAFTCILDDVRVYPYPDLELRFSGKYAIAPTDKNILLPSGDCLRVLEMEQQELRDKGNSMVEKLWSSTQLGKLMKGF